MWFELSVLCACVRRLNDVIVSVNGVTTVGVTHAGAVDALKRAGYTVDLVGCSEQTYSPMSIHSIHWIAFVNIMSSISLFAIDHNCTDVVISE